MTLLSVLLPNQGQIQVSLKSGLPLSPIGPAFSCRWIVSTYKYLQYQTEAVGYTQFSIANFYLQNFSLLLKRKCTCEAAGTNGDTECDSELGHNAEDQET